jgi:four helix bundle protein
MAKSLDELQVYQKAFVAAAEVSAIIHRPSFQRDHRLRNQLSGSSQSVAALISEGFEQSTDRHFAEYCCRSRGSSSETRTHLVAARVGRHITEAERVRIADLYEEIAKMLSGLIAHLRADDRKQRR